MAKYTQADYMALPEGFPAELLDGLLVKEPSPTAWHQTIVGKFYLRLCLLLGPNRVLVSPMDVFVDEFNVLQPDVLVLGEGDRTGPHTGRIPMPILVVEVLSLATAERDRGEKADIYLRAGVAEVWLVDLALETIEVRTMRTSIHHGADEPAESRVVRGFRLAFRELTSQ